MSTVAGPAPCGAAGGADAVIGVHLTCTVTSNQGLSALLVVATGTAVLLSALPASAR